jgi:hypothetical protein
VVIREKAQVMMIIVVGLVVVVVVECFGYV